MNQIAFLVINRHAISYNDKAKKTCLTASKQISARLHYPRPGVEEHSFQRLFFCFLAPQIDNVYL